MKGLLVLFIAFLTINSAVAQNVTIKESKARVSFLFLDDDVDGILSEFKFTGNLDLECSKFRVFQVLPPQKQSIPIIGCGTNIFGSNILKQMTSQP